MFGWFGRVFFRKRRAPRRTAGQLARAAEAARLSPGGLRQEQVLKGLATAAAVTGNIRTGRSIDDPVGIPPTLTFWRDADGHERTKVGGPCTADCPKCHELAARVGLEEGILATWPKEPNDAAAAAEASIPVPENPILDPRPMLHWDRATLIRRVENLEREARAARKVEHALVNTAKHTQDTIRQLTEQRDATDRVNARQVEQIRQLQDKLDTTHRQFGEQKSDHESEVRMLVEQFHQVNRQLLQARQTFNEQDATISKLRRQLLSPSSPTPIPKGVPMTKLSNIQLENLMKYHPPETPERLAAHELVNATILEAVQKIYEILPESRECSLFLTTMQEARMWANAAIAIHMPRKSETPSAA